MARTGRLHKIVAEWAKEVSIQGGLTARDEIALTWCHAMVDAAAADGLTSKGDGETLHAWLAEVQTKLACWTTAEKTGRAQVLLPRGQA